MRSFLDMGNPYQHALGVSIVRTDTCSCSDVEAEVRALRRVLGRPGRKAVP
jgi:hypothetical protein